MKKFVEKSRTGLFSLTKSSFRNLKVIKKNSDVIKLTGDNPSLVTKCKASHDLGGGVNLKLYTGAKAFGGTFLAMTIGSRIMGVATAGHSLLKDAVSLVEDSKHLQEDAKTESAAEL